MIIGACVQYRWCFLAFARAAVKTLRCHEDSRIRFADLFLRPVELLGEDNAILIEGEQLPVGTPQFKAVFNGT